MKKSGEKEKMKNIERNLTMLCDFYEITMGNGYFSSGMKDKTVYFDVFFRKNPDNGGYAIVAGLEQIVEYINDLLKSRHDSVSAVVGVITIKYVEIDDLILHSVYEISVAHSELVIIAKHRKISLDVFHFSPSFVLGRAQDPPFPLFEYIYW